MNRIAILASGNGTNAEAIMSHFKDNIETQVVLVISNNKDAHVLNRAANFNIPTQVFSKAELEAGNVLKKLKEVDINLVVLAGFLLLIPSEIVQEYPKRIINIHPALLPRYGGKGMYGNFVHSSVLENRDTQSGITIHYVNEKYDDGDIIFQTKCSVAPHDTPESLAAKIHILEHKYYPSIIAKVAEQL